MGSRVPHVCSLTRVSHALAMGEHVPVHPIPGAHCPDPGGGQQDDSGSIDRCLTHPGAGGGPGPPPTRLCGLGDCSRLRWAAVLGFTLTPYSLFLDEAELMGLREESATSAGFGVSGITGDLCCLCRVGGPVRAEQSVLCLPSVVGKPCCMCSECVCEAGCLCSRWHFCDAFSPGCPLSPPGAGQGAEHLSIPPAAPWPHPFLPKALVHRC